MNNARHPPRTRGAVALHLTWGAASFLATLGLGILTQPAHSEPRPETLAWGLLLGALTLAGTALCLGASRRAN